MWLATAATAFLSVLFGGGAAQGRLSDTLVQVAGLVLLAPTAWHLRHTEGRISSARVPLLILAAVLLLPLLQLVRMPAAVWTVLPGRQVIAGTFVSAGVEPPWLPLSLDPAATWRSFLSLLPASAIFLATLCLGRRGRRALTLVFISAAVLSTILGLAQLQGSSQFSLYSTDDSQGSVGLFANRNHYTGLLYTMIPFTAAWLTHGLNLVDRGPRQLSVATFLAIYAVLLLGLGLAHSRAGLVLGLVAALASMAIVGSGRGNPKRTGLVLIAAASLFGAILIVQFGLFGILGRFDTDPLGDARFMISRTTLQAVYGYLPVGSGIGTFRPIFQMFEAPADITSAYINHAHDDWLEVLLEGGLPAAAILALFAGWFLARSVAIWRDRSFRSFQIDSAIERAATIAASLLLLHSFVDYPLRTTTLMCALGFCLALLIDPPKPGKVESGAVGS